MNPGPRGPQPYGRGGSRRFSKGKVNSRASPCVEITEDIIEAFIKWVKSEKPSISKWQLTRYENYMRRALGKRLCGKSDVHTVLEAMGGLNKASHNTLSRFLTFLEKNYEFDELVAKLRKAMPPRPKSGEDTYVPSDSEILKLREKIREIGPPYTHLYNIMVSTGCRGSEALYLMNNIRNLKATKLGYGAVRVHVDMLRGPKNEFVMYLPTEVYEALTAYDGPRPDYHSMRKVFQEAGLPYKYIRKWWRQLGKRLGIDSEDLEAFQGRVSSIGGRHYTDWIPILDEKYEKIMRKITNFLI